jgi:hypothetical protein
MQNARIQIPLDQPHATQTLKAKFQAKKYPGKLQSLSPFSLVQSSRKIFLGGPTLCLSGQFKTGCLLVLGWVVSHRFFMLHLGLNGSGLRLRVGIVHLVRVHVAHSILVTGLVLLVSTALTLILAVALVFLVLVVIGSSMRCC